MKPPKAVRIGEHFENICMEEVKLSDQSISHILYEFLLLFMFFTPSCQKSSMETLSQIPQYTATGSDDPKISVLEMAQTNLFDH
jgi:hypothetical protein